MKRGFWALAALTVLTGPAWAGTPYPVKMTCPVGGEKFTHTDTMSSSTWGARPDGKPYGSWIFPHPIPECPGNRLVVFKDFSKDEIKTLTPLLETPAYRALWADTAYYRLAWLARELGVKDVDAGWVLLQASWQTDGDPARKARYQREFVAAVDAASGPDDLSTLSLQARAVNAERELGEFDAAGARAGAMKARIAAVSAKPADPDQADNFKGLGDFVTRLQLAIERKDAASEPLDLITPRVAADRCLDLEEKGTPDALCKAASLSELIEKQRAWRKPKASPGG